MTEIKLPPPCESVITIIQDGDKKTEIELVQFNQYVTEAQAGLGRSPDGLLLPDQVPIYAARLAEILGGVLGEKVSPSTAWMMGEAFQRKLTEVRQSFFAGLR